MSIKVYEIKVKKHSFRKKKGKKRQSQYFNVHKGGSFCFPSTSPIKVQQQHIHHQNAKKTKKPQQNTSKREKKADGGFDKSKKVLSQCGDERKKKKRSCLSLLVGVGPFDDPLQCAVDVGNVLA